MKNLFFFLIIASPISSKAQSFYRFASVEPIEYEIMTQEMAITWCGMVISSTCYVDKCFPTLKAPVLNHSKNIILGGTPASHIYTECKAINIEKISNREILSFKHSKYQNATTENDNYIKPNIQSFYITIDLF